MKKQYHLTPEGLAELKAELAELVSRRSEIAEEIASARSQGDLAENAEYHEARDMQGVVEDRIQKIESILKNAVIVSSHNTDLVVVGSVVKVVKEGDKVEKVYTLVGGEESDISTGKISVKSPFGEAALGKKKGESFKFNTPAGPVTYKIIGIE